MVLGLIVIVAIVALAYLPQLWVQGVISRHSKERADFPGTGGEFARHILDQMKLTHVGVEETREGDHYDPKDKVVRLLPQHMNKRSLSAVVIAAHEVGHAMQDATEYGPLKTRTSLAKIAQRIESTGSVVMLAAPILLLVTKSPAGMILSYLAGAIILSATILLHAMTLPVEFDASFKRALPVLKEGGYLKDRDLGKARHILKAAAYTYVAAAAMSLLNVARWFRVIRF